MLKPNTFALTAVLAMLTAVGPLATDMYLPSLPAITTAFQTTNPITQMTLSAFMLGFAAGQFIYGPLSDRLGRKPVLLFGLSLYTLASVVCSIAPSIETLILARFVQAFGASGPIVLARAIVRDLYEGPRAGRELSRMGTIMGIVPAIAPVIGGFIGVWFGWRGTFLFTIVCGAVLLTIVTLRLPETLHTKAQGKLSIGSMLADFGALLKHPAYRTYVVLAMLTFGGLFAFISGSSFVLQGFYGLKEMAFAFSFGIMVIGYMSGTVLATRIVGKLGFNGTIMHGVRCLAAAGILMLLLVLFGPVTSLSVSVPMALYGMGVGLTMPQAMASAMMPFPTKAGAASSLLGICQMAFAALIGIVVGHFLETSHLALPITIATTGVLAMLLFTLMKRSRIA
jgi:DHA1 family bicyclomycin/chloramphenicol resistance-like MFS transporter